MVEAARAEEAADSGYFAALASARYLQVTTFGRDGRPVPARVRGVADGDRFYFGARTWSGTVKRLRHADAVHVAPCGALGVCYGPPLDATARLLPAGEASRAAAELARKYPVRRGAAHLVASRAGARRWCTTSLSPTTTTRTYTRRTRGLPLSEPGVTQRAAAWDPGPARSGAPTSPTTAPVRSPPSGRRQSRRHCTRDDRKTRGPKGT